MIKKNTVSHKIFVLNLFFLSLFFVILLSKNISVRAQQPDAKTDVIWQKERLDEEIVRARQDYSYSFEEYRTLERQYIISYDQYDNLKTLAFLEDLVIKTKAVCLIRDQVLINYLELLRLSLYANEGVELSVKNPYLDLLEEKISGLKVHRQELEKKNSQSEVQESLDDFEQFTDVTDISDEILALLAISRLQRIYDLAVPLKEDIDQFLNVDESNALSALVRASDETDQTLNQAQSNLYSIWEDTQKKSALRRIYRNLTRELNPIYINLYQSLSYLEELLTLK
jgi:hypothetical protein